MLSVLSIHHDSVVDGDGLRTVIFFAGCPHQCEGCHNEVSWKITNGTMMSMEAVLEEIASNPLTNVTFSGGEPFMQAREVAQLAKKVKELGKNIWIYTGYVYEDIIGTGTVEMKELLSYADVLVDGPFQLENRDLLLNFRGSTNQRILYLKDV